MKLYSFHNFSLWFILKMFLKFRKFHPRYSYKIYSYKKRKSVMTSENRHPGKEIGLERADLLPKEVRHATRHWGITAKQMACQFG